MVTRKDVADTLNSLGIKNGDILLFHSSLKSFGQVDGGADAVIDGALDAVGADGTLVAPTLVQKDFSNAYKNWDIKNSPSDVGIITETLRKRPNAIRSNQATHSVSAIGKMAEFLTNSHSNSKPRPHPYGDYAFSHGSPWQKMYDLNAKIVFMGCGMEANTFHHFIEALFAEEILSALPDTEKVREMKKVLVDFDMRDEHTRQLILERDQGVPHTLIRFQFGRRCNRGQILAEQIGKTAYCGQSRFILLNVKEYVDKLYEQVKTYKEEFYCTDILNWIKEAQKI